MSFLEFIDFIQRRLINATNRKVVTDFKGGWYPTLLNVYIQYLKRSRLPIMNTLHSNGYTFENLYPFLSKYNAFFQKFVDQLLSATIILRKAGLLIRNTVFTRQKFAYKRGVYMGHIKTLSTTGATTYSFNKYLQYFGDDGSTFLKQPLTQVAEWSNDIVCVGGLCKDFLVNGITVIYPTTTTTTTVYPFTSIMTINETKTFLKPLSNEVQVGYYGYTNYQITMSPAILPGYTVNADFKFTSKNYITTSIGGNTSSTIITVKKNGIQVFTVTNQILDLNSSDVINNVPIQINNDDLIEIILENDALRNSITPTPVGSVSSSSEFMPIIINVTPSGTIPVISPISVSNILPTP